MARIRTIKPDFFSSEDIVSLSALARLYYIALWCEADREGRLEWRPGTFKLRYFPAQKVDMEALGEELVGRGLVVFYGDGLAWIPTFLKHQHVNPREADSCLPVPDACARVTHAQVGRKGKEGKERKGKEGGAATRKNGAPPLPEWLPKEAWHSWLETRTKKRAPNTENALELAVKLLDRLKDSGQSPQEVLEQSILRGWTGLFPLKDADKPVDIDRMVRELQEEEKKRAAH
jgi:hypothetical protein